MHISAALRETARASLIDLWAQEGFKVPPNKRETFFALWLMAGLPNEIRDRLGMDHEAEWKTAHTYYPK
jgi:hypothetical protein